MSVDYIKRIPLSMEWQYEDTNVYLISPESNPWLVDAGEIHENNFDVLKAHIREYELTLDDLNGICITHLHPDHAGLVFKLLEENPDLDVLIPPGLSMAKRTPERTRKWLNRIGMPDDLHDILLDEITQHKYVEFMDRLKDTVQYLEPGTVMDIGGLASKVIKTHGHTPNHVVFYFLGDGLLFSGDHVLLNETPNVSLFPEYLGGNPLGDYHDGLEILLDLGISTVFPGHGHPFHNGRERIKELLEHHGERLTHCRRAVQDDRLTAFEVAQQIPWSNKTFDNLDEIHQFLALGESMAHLIYLAEDGVLERSRTMDVDYFWHE